MQLKCIFSPALSQFYNEPVSPHSSLCVPFRSSSAQFNEDLIDLGESATQIGKKSSIYEQVRIFLTQKWEINVLFDLFCFICFVIFIFLFFLLLSICFSFFIFITRTIYSIYIITGKNFFFQIEIFYSFKETNLHFNNGDFFSFLIFR